MLKGDPKSLSELLGAKDSPLADLATAAKQREDLANYLRKNLPPELAPGFLHCNLRDQGLLVVLTTGPEWAARLRFEENRFIELCVAQGTPVDRVLVKVGQ